MTKGEIVERLARDRTVEKMCLNTARRKELTPDLADLSQSVYLILLEYDEAKLVELWEKDALGFFIARIISNQFLSKTSPFYRLFLHFRSKCETLNPKTRDD